MEKTQDQKNTTKYVTSSAEETQSIAENLAKKLCQNNKNNEPIIVTLVGDLGAGKTTFMQGFAKGLGIKQHITSPTFIIMRTYEIEHGMFYHVDLYRVNNPKELENLGLTDALQEEGNVIAIEWADKIQNQLPKNRIEINLESTIEDKREIKIIDYSQFV